ncbi:DNA polymerase III subunit gamma and tau [Streptomyces microflavus]|uniref:DNA polymerase III subunit gamma and tau n=1 Tax=Streptomyces microflavus TaxID=1919 RepID=UPI0003AB24D0|nr:DNA polymerase III subunit gamma and tau [Streptomyces microflavus]
MSSLALYRRYRPESFAEVIGQEHVTDPLQQALRNNRVNHAYLFSGPRGCGKTTSARILARCLNCEQGPTPTPCGECQSCQDLARNGPGSIDVIEIDAASHGGVDDARDLREKAFFGPASSRYKIYIIDEAHMVTPAGFNALLKVVEEPPEHLKFIFATTEPEKVIGTIRSRTHHYPFRLVPPGTLRSYLADVCGRENSPVEDGVLPLVVRAGAGSVRDSMSVMDQLLAGAADDGVTYAMATSLLGYTDSSLLDSVIDAFAAGDGAAAFEVVDRVIEGGNDPRRFVADLLERLRDLVILAAVPDAGEKGLIDAPADVVERMQAQASVFGAAELSRAADLVNEGLTEMRGATSPRLQVELICARVLLPAAFDDERSMQARLDRLERGASAAAAASFAAPPAAAVPMGYVPGPEAHAPQAHVPQAAPAAPAGPDSARAAVRGEAPAPAPAAYAPPAAGAAGAEGAAPAAGGQGMAQGAGQVRSMWPDILEAVKNKRRFTWILLSQNAQVTGFDGTTLQIGFINAGARDNFASTGSEEVLKQALAERFNAQWRVEAVVDASGGGAVPPAPGGGRPPAPQYQPAPASSPSTPTPTAYEGNPAHAPQQHTQQQPHQSHQPPSSASQQGRSAAPPAPEPSHGGYASESPRSVAPEDDTAEADDPDLVDSALSGHELIVRELGATVVEEFNNEQ